MKILEPGFQLTRTADCRHCGAVVEYTLADIHVQDWHPICYVVCPEVDCGQCISLYNLPQWTMQQAAKNAFDAGTVEHNLRAVK